MLEAAKNYSITHLKSCGFAISIASFAYLVDFDTTVDYLALSHIDKHKAKPATNKIKRLLGKT